MDNKKPNSTTDSKTQAYDPGWNDPPKFSYSAQQIPPNRPRNFLNKRVAFPLTNTPISNSSSPLSLPPMPLIPPLPTMPPTLSPVIIRSEPEIIPEIQDSQNTLKEVKEILLQFLESSNELGPKSKDIKKRIDVMEDMWLSGKLNARIHEQMKNLAKAIQDDQPAKADEIHKALMVDHVSSVSVWMSGVKQLIRHCIARSELLSIEKEELCRDIESENAVH